MNQENFNNQPLPRFDPQTGQPIHYPKEKESFTLMEILFAWITLLAGYAFCRAFPVTDHPFGGFLYIAGLFLITYAVLIIKRASFGWMPILISASALLISPALFITANSFFHFLIFVYALMAWCYLVYGAQGNLLERGFSDLLLIDFFKAVYILPFSSFGKLFSALSSNKDKKKKGFLGKILLGVAITVIPTAIIVALLSYDSQFVALFQKLFIVKWSDLFLHMLSFLLGIPIAMYLFGLFYSSEKGKCADTITAEKCRTVSLHMKRLPQLTALASVVPILLIYGIFFASQWDYYLSAFSGILPDEVTCAEYARSGFFQLCAVSVINMIIIYLLGLFVRRKTDAPTLLTRIISVLFSLATLVLMATAFSKLYLYIDRFGLTPLRVYAAWFMIILAVLFLLVIVKQIFHRFRLVPVGALVCVLLFGALTLSGIDTKIAEYNTDRYLNGTLDTVDVAAMEELGDAAIPSMVRLALDMDQKNGTDITALTYEQVYWLPYEKEELTLYEELCEALYDAAEGEESTFFSFSLPRAKAEKALKEAGIQKLEAPKEYY